MEVHGGIRHLESQFLFPVGHTLVHGGIRHLEKNLASQIRS